HASSAPHLALKLQKDYSSQIQEKKYKKEEAAHGVSPVRRFLSMAVKPYQQKSVKVSVKLRPLLTSD
ncbi:MAG: hypothetical protein KDD92_09795, partial [Caldilineaceae bacterium]|nr:hypothetical protein [Caldilineaceae bacterium]